MGGLKLPLLTSKKCQHAKTTNHFKGDKIEYTISSNNITNGSVYVVNDKGEEIYSENFTLLEGDKISEKVSIRESGEYTTTITIRTGDGEVYVDIEKQLFLDYIVYPVGAAILMFGLHKRKEENVSKSYGCGYRRVKCQNSQNRLSPSSQRILPF